MQPAFLTQRPRLVWRPGERRPLVSVQQRSSAPALAGDFAALDDILMPVFHRLDEDALRAQNSYRLGQVLIILGGSLATALGSVQAALGGGVTALGLAGALVSGALAAVVAYVRQSDVQKQYLTARLKAERLRGEYFRYLARLAPYGAGDQSATLRAQVDAIEYEEPA
jgi:Protein of unknown function (DUF4231)